VEIQPTGLSTVSVPEVSPVFDQPDNELLEVGSGREVHVGSTMRAMLAALVVLAAVAVGFAAGRATTHRAATVAVAAPSRSISTVVLIDQYNGIGDGPTPLCTGSSPFADVNDAAPVVITNPSGRIVGARLGDGRASRNQCAFSLNVTVPADWGWYVVRIGLHESRAMTLAQLATTPITFG
jgi:hypothetical protein